MTPRARSTTDTPTWDDVREEASALTREVMQQSLVWSRRAFKVANSAAETAAKAMEGVTEKTTENLRGVSERTARSVMGVTERTAESIKKAIKR